MEWFAENTTLQTRIILPGESPRRISSSRGFFQKKEKWDAGYLIHGQLRKNVFIRPNCPILEHIALKQDCVYSAMPGQCFGKLKVRPMFFIVWPAHTRLGLLYFSAA
jgi:hypothetical protein